MSLYRKYRPQSFADVSGQEPVVTTLEQAANQDKLAHAYLFAGNRGTGKTSVARIMAKIIMTKGLEDEVVKKQIIEGIERGSLVDLLEIDAASNRGIDDIRDLVEKIQFSPVVASAKVYIIDEVHMLTKEAFNALLKTLEEPPEYAYFILATTELHKIPATIQSRCQCFPFRNIRDEDIVRRLQYIADQERIDIEREALRTIARHVQGGLRDAISLLDQLRSLEKITLNDVLGRIGSTGHEYIDRVLTGLHAKKPEAVIEAVQTMEDAGIQLDTFVRQMLNEIRKDMHADIEQGKSVDAHVTLLDTLLEALKNMRVSPVPGLVLESALVEACSNGGSIQTKTAPKQTPERVQATPSKAEENEEEIPKETAVVKESHNEEEKMEQSDTSAIIEASDVTKDVIEKEWSRVVKETQPASVRMSLKDGRITDVENDKITLAFTSAFHKDKVADIEASRAVETVMESIFKKHLKLECRLDAGGTKAQSNPTDSDVNLAEAASEIF